MSIRRVFAAMTRVAAVLAGTAQRLPLRAALPAAGLVLVLGAATQSPRAMRHMEAFRVERVEVHGTRYMAPADVLAAAGIDSASNVWDAEHVWTAALERHPMIRSARIQRKLPSTLRVSVEETAPVALARVPMLQPVDAAGRVLPIRPEDAGLDLPVLAEPSELDASGRLINPRMLAAVEAYGALKALEPTLAESVSEIAAVRGTLVLMLRLSEPAAVALPLEAGPDRLRQVRRALEDIARRGEMPALRLVDGRFRDQVVVSLTRSESI